MAVGKTDPIQDPYKKRKYSVLHPVEKVAHGKVQEIKPKSRFLEV